MSNETPTPTPTAPVVDVTDELVSIAMRAFLAAPVYASDAATGEGTVRGMRAALVAAFGGQS